MTRKRYCKLMMAKGWSRNAANASADRVRKAGSYAELWFSNCFTAQALVDALNAVVKNLRPAIQAVCLSVTGGLERMADPLRRINIYFNKKSETLEAHLFKKYNDNSLFQS